MGGRRRPRRGTIRPRTRAQELVTFTASPRLVPPRTATVVARRLTPFRQQGNSCSPRPPPLAHLTATRPTNAHRPCRRALCFALTPIRRQVKRATLAALPTSPTTARPQPTPPPTTRTRTATRTPARVRKRGNATRSRPSRRRACRQHTRAQWPHALAPTRAPYDPTLLADAPVVTAMLPTAGYATPVFRLRQRGELFRTYSTDGLTNGATLIAPVSLHDALASRHEALPLDPRPCITDCYAFAFGLSAEGFAA